MNAANDNGSLRHAWVRALFHPANILRTFTVLAILFYLKWPALGQELVSRVLILFVNTFGPLIGMLLPFGIVALGFWVMLGMPGRKKKKKKASSH